MAKRDQKLKYTLEHALPWVVLIILLFYTYAKFAQHPYSGFRLSTDGHIETFYVSKEEQPLREGDRIIQIDSLRWEDFKADYRKTIFKGVQPGQVVQLVIERDDLQTKVLWVYPGPNPLEVLDLIVSEGWLAYVFWIAGTLTYLHLRPRDERRALMMAFNYLTAIWLVAGSGVSFYHVMGSAFTLRMAVWLCIPVYLHFHWVYPKPFRKLPAQVTWGLYIVASAFALAEGFQLLHESSYFLGFLLAVGGSLLLLVAHVILQPEARRDLRLLLIAALLALVPALIVGFLGTFSAIPTPSGAGTIGLPFLPLTYFYASYRRQLGQSELRVNRWISMIIFLILVGAVTATFTSLASLWIMSAGDALLFGAVLALLITLISVWGFPHFQMFVERRILRIPLPPSNLLETYSARLATSTFLSSLLRLLNDEVLPSLLVRQFAFLKLDNNSPDLLLAVGVTDEQIFTGCDFNSLMGASGTYRPAYLLSAEQPCPWARLILPLKVGDSVIGFWLFGRRDPDDMYSQADIPILKSLANQTAIALSNILQADRLRALYQANVNRFEDERLHLARELHDSILNQLAVLQMNLDDTNPSPKFQEAYDGLTQRLREIVSDLRPPMLNYGLKSALEELADNLMERSKETVSVMVGLQSDGSRYPSEVELHLFRIIQEACENALRHAQAKSIKISGSLNAQEINLHLQDDGIGFYPGEALDLDTLIAKKHFGLAGMVERAAIIGARVGIESGSKEGTRLQIIWKRDYT